MDRLRCTKRRKVKEDPNILFASIKTIGNDQRLVGRETVTNLDSSEGEDSDDALNSREVFPK